MSRIQTTMCGCVTENCSNTDPDRTEKLAHKDCSLCGGSGDLEFTVEYDPKPIPDRQFDWMAIPAGFEEETKLYGYGETRQKAIRNMQENIGEYIYG